MVTVQGTVLGPNDAKPDAGSVIQFRLSGSFANASGVVIPPVTQQTAISSTDGTFSISLEPTTTGLPSNRFYEAVVVARFSGVPANYRVAKCRLRSSPSSQNLGNLSIGEEPEQLHISREEPIGIVDGVNTGFFLRRIPQDGSELYFLNEQLQREDAYLLVNNQLLPITPPTPGQRQRLFYLNSAYDAPGHISRETPDGIIDGVNAVFTLRSTPATGLEMGFLNESYQIPIVHYTISGNTITFVTPPPIGSRIRFWYPTANLYPYHRRDIFTGDGVTTAFALTGPILRCSEMVFDNGNYQERNQQLHYYLSADQKTLNFVTPPGSGQKAVAYYEEGD